MVTIETIINNILEGNSQLYNGKDRSRKKWSCYK